MSSHLFHKGHIEFANEPLFLGTGRNIARLDLNIEQHIQKMVDDALAKMWFAGDFSYIEDGKDYLAMSIDMRALYLKNLKFQNLLDSVAARSVLEVFLPCTTNPQLEQWWYQHGFFENNVHSKTYAEIIKALPVNAKEIFDTIMIDENILKRANGIVELFEDTVYHNAMMIIDHKDYHRENHQLSIVKSLYALNILEAILFKSSFLVSFAFKENGMMNATGDAIKKIQLDEIGHYGMTINIINRLRKDTEWIHLFAEAEPQIQALYKTVVEADYMWIDHLFEDDVVLLGISRESAKLYVDYNAKVVMTSIGLKPLKDDVFNPCVWANKYSKSSNVQTAQKEKNNANYLLGALDTYVSQDFWEGMDKFLKKDDE